ncbi:MAG: hypothetical protein KF739_04640 [Cryobacterium sp.]|nr:hypothetical protein [Cryobacterium sp.]
MKPGASAVSSSDSEFIAACIDEAEAMVTARIGTATDAVPPVIQERAVIEVASELYNRQQAPNGLRQFAAPDGGQTAIRVSRDPLVAANAILAPFLPLGFA